MSISKKITWHKLASDLNEINFASNGLAMVSIAGRQVCLSTAKQYLQACAAKCPHAGGIMADGYVDALGNIVCPVHRYKFNLQNGRNITGEGYYLKVYPVEVRPDGIYIGFEENKLSS